MRVLASISVVLLALALAAVVGWPAWWREWVVSGLVHTAAGVALVVATALLVFSVSFLFYLAQTRSLRGAMVEGVRCAWDACGRVLDAI